jgi:hypothetical protein
MSFSKQVAAGVMAGFLISVPWVQAQTSRADDGAGPVSRTSLVRSDAMGSYGAAGTIPENVESGPPCKGADGAANRALDGVTLEDFAPAALASLTHCELRTLENQIGAGEEAEAILAAYRTGRAQIASVARRR